jgi:hypothetical protein
LLIFFSLLLANKNLSLRSFLKPCLFKSKFKNLFLKTLKTAKKHNLDLSANIKENVHLKAKNGFVV